MNAKIKTNISNFRSITKDFMPVWRFDGVVVDFTEPLSDENRKQASEIVAVLNKLLEKTE